MVADCAIGGMEWWVRQLDVFGTVEDGQSWLLGVSIYKRDLVMVVVDDVSNAIPRLTRFW